MLVKSSDNVIDDLIDVVSKNGNLLLNISPKADGTIPEDQQYVLFELGNWLKVNGEAIYGSRPWKIFGEGPTVEDLGDTHMTERKNLDRKFSEQDFRFTTKGKDIFAICMGKPEGKVIISSLKKDSPLYDYEIENLQILGWDGDVNYEVTDDGLLISLPTDYNASGYATTFKIEGGELNCTNLAQ